MADYYATLGVTLEANRTSIQAAYRRLARLHHPDFGGDPAMMAALNEAWSVLGHPQLRSAYDATRRRTGGLAPETTNAPTAGPTAPRPAGPIAAAAERHSGTAPDRASTVSFGRYTGWTIAQLAIHDPDYLEWLARAPIGRVYRQEIYLQLARRPAPQTTYAGRGGTATMDRPGTLRSRLGLHRRR